MAGDGHRIGPPGGIPHGAHHDAEEVAAVGVADDIPARQDLGGVAPLAVCPHRRVTRVTPTLWTVPAHARPGGWRRQTFACRRAVSR